MKHTILILIIVTVCLASLMGTANAASTDPDIIINCSWYALHPGESSGSCGPFDNQIIQSTYPMTPVERQECLDNLHPVIGQNNNCDDLQSAIYPIKTEDETKCSGSNPGNSNCCCTYSPKSGCRWQYYWPEYYHYSNIIGNSERLDYEPPFKACGSNVPFIDPICNCGAKTEKSQSGSNSLAGSNRISPPVNFTPSVTIPSSKFQAGSNISLEEKSTTYIGQYISGFYNYAMGIIGILAVIVFMIAGIIWLTSAGNPSKISQAKDLMIGSITGLILLLTSWILLNTVNPALIEFKITKIGEITEK